MVNAAKGQGGDQLLQREPKHTEQGGQGAFPECTILGWDNFTAGLLFQTVRDLGIPPECIENINRTLVGSTKEAQIYFKQRRLELPGRIRVFCQKKMIEDINSSRISSPLKAEQTMEHTPIIHHSSTKMNGGWGYFLIKRGWNVSADSSVDSYNSVDLYLYKEGG